MTLTPTQPQPEAVLTIYPTPYLSIRCLNISMIDGPSNYSENMRREMDKIIEQANAINMKHERDAVEYTGRIATLEHELALARDRLSSMESNHARETAKHQQERMEWESQYRHAKAETSRKQAELDEKDSELRRLRDAVQTAVDKGER